MADNNSTTPQDLELLQEPYNTTDIFVQFDPEVEKPEAAMPYQTETDGSDGGANYESTKVDAIEKPIIVVNQQIINPDMIESFSFKYEGFTPELDLVINDPKGDFQFMGSQGMRNHVTVILCPDVDGMFRSIGCLFYIKERFNLYDSQIQFKCEYLNLGLTDVACMQLGDKPLTTYEMCSEVAKKTGLGFACTDKCKDISDERWRQMYSQKVYKFVQEQVALGGVDNDSFFDCWVDTHGYLNLVNLSYIFSSEIKMENLAIPVQPKVHVPVNGAPEGEQFMTQRTISDMPNYPIDSLRMTRKYAYLNTETTSSLGTETSFWILNSAGDENTLEMQDIRMVEETVEGEAKPEEYTFRRVEFLGCEMSEDKPYLIQQETRRHWIAKKKTKQLTVHLLKPNYGLERGTLINVMTIDTNPAHMRRISQNADNATTQNNTDGQGYAVDDTKPPIPLGEASDEGAGMINPTMSGMYYIDGMRYVYNKENKAGLEQILFLIKKSLDSPLIHLEASPVLTTDQAKQIEEQVS